MKIAIMQPYFFPYIGYFQLMNAVDAFVIYDNIEFTKKGWINRNRVLVNGKDSFISLPLKKDSDFLHVKDRSLAEVWKADRQKMLNRITESYRRAQNFETVFPIVERVVLFEESNLFEFILNSLSAVKDYLDIKSAFMISSKISIDHNLKAEEKVLALCKARKASTYFNPIGGKELYNKNTFNNEGISLHFLKTNEISYPQFDSRFIPFLSILDVMMFNSKEEIRKMLTSFTLE